MVPVIKTNFSSQYVNNLTCDLCTTTTDSQENLLTCAALSKNVKIPDSIVYNMKICSEALKTTCHRKGFQTTFTRTGNITEWSFTNEIFSSSGEPWFT